MDGKMGYAIAEAVRDRGGNPVLVSTATSIPVVVGVNAPTNGAPDSMFIIVVEINQVTNFEVTQFDVSFDPNVVTIGDMSPDVGITDGNISGTSIPVVQTNQCGEGETTVMGIANAHSKQPTYVRRQ